ncbi:MAG TPA: hypothetical protein VEZ71_27460 [Archangium sp.]|nr:hypothetical protein [Archangium sp.]
MTDTRKPPEAGPTDSGRGEKSIEDVLREAEKLGIQVGRPKHLQRPMTREPSLARATREDSERFHTQLEELVRSAHAAGVEVAAWVGFAVRQVAAELPGGAVALVEQRPGSWESDLVYQLATDTEEEASRGALDETTAHHLHALVQLVRQAHAAHVEIAGWLAAALGHVAKELPNKADDLLGARTSFGDVQGVLRLVCGTIGWPEGA